MPLELKLFNRHCMTANIKFYFNVPNKKMVQIQVIFILSVLTSQSVVCATQMSGTYDTQTDTGFYPLQR